MLPKPHRLNLKTDFKWVASGKSVKGNSFKLFIRYGDNQKAKVGIALSKSQFKKAVERNRARRLMSKAFELCYQSLPANINIVALPQWGILQLRAEEILADLKQLLTDSHAKNL